MVRMLSPKNPWTYNYGADAIDGDMMALSYVQPAPPALAGFNPRDIMGGGAPVSATNMPTKLRLKGRKRKLLDLDNQFHIFMLGPRFIEVVERLQKEIQYFPIECFWHDGFAAGRRFFFFTTVLLDAMKREHTTIPWTLRGNGIGMWRDDLPEAQDKKFVFDKRLIGDAHIWVDPYMPTRSPLVSEALYAALKKEKIECFHDAPRRDEV